ncbi:MAG: GNAT family N-acetyltransferase [Candidatus Methanomethylicaceae archaeon]
MKCELQIRSYQSGDEVHILELFRHSYGRELAEQAWAWRFRDNPAGPAVIELAWDGNTLVAHYAVSLVVLRVNGNEWLTGLSGTTMTHPNYRGRGLFPLLARRTYARMAALNMPIVWGFPNRISHRGFARDLNWVDIWEVPTFRLSLRRDLPITTVRENVVELEDFDERFTQLWERVKDDYQVIVKRDRRYLNWRYVQNPTERYRILAYLDGEDLLGYAVLKRHKEELHVVDLLALRGTDIGEQLISRAAQIALEDSVSAVSLWLNPTHPLHWALEILGFQNEGPVTYFGGLVLCPDLVGTMVYDYRKWYLTMGDSDVY